MTTPLTLRPRRGVIDGRVSSRQAALLLVAVVVAWGLTWPVTKAILQVLSPVSAVALRLAIATIALFVISAGRGGLAVPPRADLPVVLSITLLHIVGFSVLMSMGLTFVPTGRSVVLAYTTPLWVTPGASLFLKEPLTARRAIGVVLGLLGLIVLFNPLAFDWANREAVLGNAALLAAALLWAGSILHIRGHLWHSTPFDLLPWEMLLATVILVPAALAVDGVPAIRWTGGLVLMVLYAALPGTALAYWAMAVANRTLPAVTMSLGSLGVPVVSIVTATLALGEALTPSLVAAVALVLSGVAIGATGGNGHAAPAGRHDGGP